MRALWLLAAPLFAAVVACSDTAEAPTGEESVVRFTRAGNEATLEVEIADTPGERQAGLMGRESLPEDTGMLFVWDDDTTTGFWMRDTTIPLSIAFITAGGVVIDVQDMEPLSEEVHNSPEPYRYAVEANQGWFDDNDVEPGDVVQLPVGVGS